MKRLLLISFLLVSCNVKNPPPGMPVEPKLRPSADNKALAHH